VNVELAPGQNYNPYFPGGKIAMARPLQDGQVEYDDGTPATTSQMAKDVTIFLQVMPRGSVVEGISTECKPVRCVEPEGRDDLPAVGRRAGARPAQADGPPGPPPPTHTFSTRCAIASLS
jgi:hypothetical protein